MKNYKNMISISIIFLFWSFLVQCSGLKSEGEIISPIKIQGTDAVGKTFTLTLRFTGVGNDSEGQHVKLFDKDTQMCYLYFDASFRNKVAGLQNDKNYNFKFKVLENGYLLKGKILEIGVPDGNVQNQESQTSTMSASSNSLSTINPIKIIGTDAVGKIYTLTFRFTGVGNDSEGQHVKLFDKDMQMCYLYFDASFRNKVAGLQNDKNYNFKFKVLENGYLLKGKILEIGVPDGNVQNQESQTSTMSASSNSLSTINPIKIIGTDAVGKIYTLTLRFTGVGNDSEGQHVKLFDKDMQMCYLYFDASFRNKVAGLQNDKNYNFKFKVLENGYLLKGKVLQIQ